MSGVCFVWSILVLKGAKVRLVTKPIGSCFCMCRCVYELMNPSASCRANSSFVAV